MKRIQGLDILQTLEACGSGHAEAAQRSIESLKFAGAAVFTDVEAFCQSVKRKGG